ncbi:MAG: DUF3010 family protein [Bacillota bacterium]|nr:DUF3010 family protein [Bacillota bacterium]MDP3050458.1 DUF3010 family protein [Eubacteriales bacterium]MDZ7611136.1 DUF3010 family protein [Eubacteriales bacterium]
MSTVCGIELSGSEAHIVTLRGSKLNHTIVAPDMKKLVLSATESQADIRSFRATFCSFLSETKIDRAGIVKRTSKGSFAAGGLSFKLEALIQSCDITVVLAHPRTLEKTILAKPPARSIDELAPHKYLANAYKMAYHLLDD